MRLIIALLLCVSTCLAGGVAPANRAWPWHVGGGATDPYPQYDDTVLRWKFAASNAVQPDDSFVGTNDGTVAYGPVWSTNGYTYGGGGEIIYVVGTSAWNYTNNCSAFAWVYPHSSGGGGGGRIFDAETFGSSTPGFLLATVDTDKMLWYNSTAGGLLYSPAGSLPDNAWSHVGFTITSAQLLTIYVNGNPVTNASITGTTKTGYMWVGNNSARNRGLDGVIDNPTVWKTALTLSEVTNLFKVGRP